MESIPSGVLDNSSTETLTDEQIVASVLNGQAALFELIMRRYNQRLYRVARAILRNDTEAEDVMQETYVRAYQHLDQFAHRASFSTWITRIAVYESLARLRNRSRVVELDATKDDSAERLELPSTLADPEKQLSIRQLNQTLEAAILSIPQKYRTVLILRDVEQLSTSETAACLEISEQNVKVKLLRARAMVRKALYSLAGATSSEAFLFRATRCDRMVQEVFARLQLPQK
jgi:RNA polymerase sigma-70 factor, ECF subfamily